MFLTRTSQTLVSRVDGQQVRLRPAVTADVPRIEVLMQPLVHERVLLGKDLVELYGAVQEFTVAEHCDTGELVGCGALHVMWQQLGEVRSLAVAPAWLGRGIGKSLCLALEERAKVLGLKQLFCLTFETGFFAARGFQEIGEDARVVAKDVFLELLRSNDEGVAEFLNLARVKPNTLGNTRMLKSLAS